MGMGKRLSVSLRGRIISIIAGKGKTGEMLLHPRQRQEWIYRVLHIGVVFGGLGGLSKCYYRCGRDGKGVMSLYI